MNKFNYGVSFNCMVGFDEVGGGGEGWSTVDYVGNDLEKIETFLLQDLQRENDDERQRYSVSHEHDYMERQSSVGEGRIKSVIIGEYHWSDTDIDKYVLCVIFEDPNPNPTVIE